MKFQTAHPKTPTKETIHFDLIQTNKGEIILRAIHDDTTCWQLLTGKPIELCNHVPNTLGIPVNNNGRPLTN